jgi:hypothetical protein
MNALFIGPYRQNDDWGFASIDYIRALLSNPDIKLTTRPYYYINNVNTSISPNILECENTVYSEYDIIIQKLLPHSLYTSNKGSSPRNYGIINVETGGWINTRAVIVLNKLDGIFVTTTYEKKWLEQSGVTTQVYVVPRPVDVDFIIANSTNKIQLPSCIDHTFKFYCYADYSDRPHLDIIIRAFNIAFTETDRVSLIIKTSNTDKGPSDLRNRIQNDISKIKEQLEINKTYKNELIITEYFDEKNMIGLHNAADCFISIASGNNFCKQTLIARSLGKTPIVMDNTGLCDFVDNTSGFVIKSEKVPVIMTKKPLPSEYEIFSADRFWYTPKIYSLVETMKKAFDMYKNNHKNYTNKSLNAEQVLHNYSYAKIGKKLCI